jgi:hypothetical protein
MEKLAVVRREGYEGPELRFADAKHEPVSWQTKPEIRLSWSVAPLGTW